MTRRNALYSALSWLGYRLGPERRARLAGRLRYFVGAIHQVGFCYCCQLSLSMMGHCHCNWYRPDSDSRCRRMAPYCPGTWAEEKLHA